MVTYKFFFFHFKYCPNLSNSYTNFYYNLKKKKKLQILFQYMHTKSLKWKGGFPSDGQTVTVVFLFCALENRSSRTKQVLVLKNTREYVPPNWLKMPIPCRLRRKLKQNRNMLIFSTRDGTSRCWQTQSPETQSFQNICVFIKAYC